MDRTAKLFIDAAAEHFFEANVAIRAANALGKPIELAIDKVLPAKASSLVATATHDALMAALKASLLTTPKSIRELTFEDASKESRIGKWGHTILTSGTGALSGFFGLIALPFELPVTTCLMLRSIAVTARNFGEDLSTLETRLECLNVFALSGANDAGETGYYATRATLQKAFQSAAEWAAKKTIEEIADAVAKGEAPLLFRVILKIAERFEVVVTEKMLLQSVPIISTATAAAINAIFSEHVGESAFYHFGMRSLERAHGREEVQKVYAEASGIIKDARSARRRKHA